MNIESPASKTTKKPKTINKVIQDHFETIDKGTFNVASFNADLQAVPTEDVDSRKCVKTLMKLTKDNITGDANSKIVTNVEKMTDILIEKYTIKKPNLCEAHFFPSVDSEAKIIEYLKAAKKSIYTCMFTITNEHLCSALLDAHLRGLDVKLLTDDEQFRLMGNYVKDLSEEGVPVRTDATTQALMHNKFTVIDQKILITGSYNWTVRATKANLENIVILDNQDLVAIYAKEFNKLWADYSAHTISNMHGKNKLKTKLYQKYQEGLAKLAKQKLKHDLKKSKEEDEKVKGVIPQSKKISKLPKATEPKNTKKGKKATPNEDHEDENKTVGVNLDMSGLLKLIYLFLIVALTGHWVRHAAVSSA